jgi:hypothetical protein
MLTNFAVPSTGREYKTYRYFGVPILLSFIYSWLGIAVNNVLDVIIVALNATRHAGSPQSLIMPLQQFVCQTTLPNEHLPESETT